MSTEIDRAPTFSISNSAAPSTTVVAGFSAFGLAGLTAVDFLVDHLELEETGHLSAEYLPSITPFENGTPRHQTRLFSRPDAEYTVLGNASFCRIRAETPYERPCHRGADGSGC